MHRVTFKRVAAVVAAVLLLVGITACSGGPSRPSGQDNERHLRQSQYDQVTDKQPQEPMPYSPTRTTINAWIKTWRDPSALAYTYIKDQDGSVGYYVFQGPPVSYNVGLTPPYDTISVDCGDATDCEEVVPAPGVDSVFYSSGGGDPVFYGIDAVTGGVVAFSVGQGQNMQYFSQPNGRYKNAEPLGDATIAAAKKKQ